MKKIILAAAIGLSTLAAQAQTQSYVEVSYVNVKSSVTFGGDVVEASPGALRGMFGYDLNPNLAFEGMVAVGLKDDALKVNGTNTVINAEIDHAIGLYLKPKAKLTDALEVFARLGYASAKATLSANGDSVSDTGGSASFGAGFSYTVASKTSLTLDYMQYYKKEGVKARGVSGGVSFKF